MKRKISRELAVRKLYELAMGRANDAVALVFRQDLTEEDVGRLDLTAVAEFRRSNLGSVEIRFIDRVKALAALVELLESEGEDTGALLRGMLAAEEEEEA